jgi:hypothetical protein
MLDQFRNTGRHPPGAPVDVRLVVTLCLKSGDESE